MRNKFTLLLTATCALVLLAGSQPTKAQNFFWQRQGQGQGMGPRLSQGEQDALKVITTATEPDAKMAGVEAFMKKYPKSAVRSQLATRTAEEIAKVGDSAKMIGYAQRYQAIFDKEDERALIKPMLLDAYVGAGRADDAAKLAAEMLAKNADDTHALIQMTILAADQATKANNPNYLADGVKYGLKAIEIIEANKKPASVNEATWASEKALLPSVYQKLGLLYMASRNYPEAKARLNKAITLAPADPTNFAFLGYMINDEYVEQAIAYKKMPAGKPKDDVLKTLEGMLDAIIDLYAHALAVGQARPEYQGLVQQVTSDMTNYYRYRHKSTDGMQQLIDKYKLPPKP